MEGSKFDLGSMMEPFLMYVIICISPMEVCEGVMFGSPWVFRNQRDCIVFAGKVLDAYRVRLKERDIIFIDGTAFCLKFKESKKT